MAGRPPQDLAFQSALQTRRQLERGREAIQGTAGVLAQSPCRGVTLPRVEHEQMRFLNPVEIACLAEVIRPGYQALVFVGAYGGLRIGELAGLRRSRVDLGAGTVDVAETVVEVEGRLLFGPPKTRAGRRRIGLPRRVVDELRCTCERRAARPIRCSAPRPGAAARDRVP